MTTVPVMTFVLAVLLVFVFEAGYSFLYSRMRLSLEKAEWAVLYWLAIGTVGFTSGVMSIKHPIFTEWMPFYLVAFLHIFLTGSDPWTFAFRRREPNSGSASGKGWYGGEPNGTSGSGKRKDVPGDGKTGKD